MNAQALLRLIRNNEKAADFNLGQWCCGTYGCLVGNDLLACGHRASQFSAMTFKEAGEHYGISSLMASFLFGRHEVDRGPNGIAVTQYSNGELVITPMDHWEGFRRQRDLMDKGAAVRRIQKYLYYNLHKRELLYNDRGCIREAARRAEGDHHVLRSVASAVERKERELAATPSPAGLHN